MRILKLEQTATKPGIVVDRESSSWNPGLEFGPMVCYLLDPDLAGFQDFRISGFFLSVWDRCNRRKEQHKMTKWCVN
jgi:hypothetical protein